MSFAFRASLLFMALSLFTIHIWAQSQSDPKPALSEINDLAAGLIGAMSEEEQENLLKRKPELMNSSLIAALKAIADPLVHKGDYTQAQRICQIEVRIAEKIGNQAALGYALIDLGLIYYRQNHTSPALECYQKSLAIFERLKDKKATMVTLDNIGDALIQYSTMTKH